MIFLLYILFWITLSFAGGMLAVKYYYTRQKKVNKQGHKLQLFLLYSRSNIIGTSSNEYREFMKRCNTITIVAWALAGLAILAYCLNSLENR